MDRVVFLVDMNAFYISCERLRHPEIEGMPAAVAGDPKNRSGIILTANYEARNYGIYTTMTVGEALKRCPNLIIIPPDHSYYEEKSRQVMDVLGSYTPTVEQNSIDEAWLDMSGFEQYFGKPMDIALRIMNQIQGELGLWCSIGVAQNKFLAKMASDIKKPMGITSLWPEEIKTKMWPMTVGKMYGIGKQTEQKLKNIGITTIGELACYPVEHLSRLFGKSGYRMHQLANGIDHEPVEAVKEDDMKSIGRSVTLAKDTRDVEEIKRILLELSDDIGMSARKHSKKGRTIQIQIKYSDFHTITRQTTVDATCFVRDIYEVGMRLFVTHWTGDPIRLIGISITGFEVEEAYEQLSLFHMLKEKQVEQKGIECIKPSSSYIGNNQIIDDENRDKDMMCKENQQEMAWEMNKLTLPSDDINRGQRTEKLDRLENAIYQLRNKYGASIIKSGGLINTEGEKE